MSLFKSIKGRRRTRRFQFAFLVEPALESRVLMTTMPSYGMYPMNYSPDEWLEKVTADVQVAVRYDYLGNRPHLLFNSFGINKTDSLNNHDSSVPFIISGSTTGPATIEITDSRGLVTTTPTQGGMFSHVRFESTVDIPPGGDVKIKVRVLTKGGKEIAEASASDKVVAEDVRMADELFNLRPAALKFGRDQAMHLTDKVIDDYFTEQKVLDLALEIVEANPDGPGLLQTVDDLRNVRIAGMKTVARNFAGQAAEDALDFALKGDMQIYRFKATSKHPAFPGFAAGIAEMRNGIDFLHPKVGLALGNLPGLDDLDRIVTQNSPDDIKLLFGTIQPVVSVSAPIKFEGATLGSIEATGTGVSINDLSEGRLNGSTSIPNLKVTSSMGYSREVDQDVFGIARLRCLFKFNISGQVEMQSNPSGETESLFDHRTRDTTFTIDGGAQFRF